MSPSVVWGQEITQAEKALIGESDAAEAAFQDVRRLSKGIQALKKDVIELNSDLRILEEKLLFPSGTKYTFFVSVNSGQFFDLESVKLKLDGKVVASHLYSPQSREALARGGVQKLFITNLSEGKHTATVFFTGVGSNQRPFKRAAEVEFKKGTVEGYMEIAIIDDASLQEPVFELKQW